MVKLNNVLQEVTLINYLRIWQYLKTLLLELISLSVQLEATILNQTTERKYQVTSRVLTFALNSVPEVSRACRLAPLSSMASPREHRSLTVNTPTLITPAILFRSCTGEKEKL